MPAADIGAQANQLKETIMSKKRKEVVPNNPVAKHCRTFNKAVTMVDRKKDARRGAAKHNFQKYQQAA